MFLADLCKNRRHELVTVRATQPVRDAVKLLVTNGIGAIPVTDESGGLVGIFSERDLARCIHDHGAEAPGREVAAYMTRDPVTCGMDSDLNTVMTLMNQHHVRHLPVMQAGKPVAMVSIRDVVERLVAVLADERDGLREYIRRWGLAEMG